MNPTEMVRSIVILSGSTLSRLFKTTNYEEMEQKMFKWMEWVANQQAHKSWESWVDCWAEYSGETF
jgi:hypothetical protein